ncbi:MAG: sigma-70 family RNA polymerase sigma factor [Mogibacterium sp.]|nr:sigma-70 family RNA polymerase sigma factor [Mogibacterium sp.]MBR4090471.1 sigma-70 family RNA polymerase sigma factor [Mogibacterium sp.]
MGVRNSFEKLDQSYLDDLVVRAGKGNSNAFAELFASVSGRQLYYLERLYGDRDRAVQALREVFINVLKGLPGLTRPDLFMPWISRQSANIYYEHTGSEETENGEFSLSQLLNLPLAESQIMLMSAEQGLSVQEIEAILNIGKSTVTRFTRLGMKHLRRGEGAAGRNADATTRKKGAKAPDINKGLTPVEAAEMLSDVFDACGSKHNNIPMEALASYAVYRKERFSVQRSILAVALTIFMLLPLLFFLPGFTVEEKDEGARGLPVYTVEVKSLLPVNRVLAILKDHSLPVYEAGAKEFTVEPIRNGKLSISVELINRQMVTDDYDVTGVDAEGPKLIDNKAEGDTFIIKVEDAGIGVDYRAVYAVGASGEVYYPLSFGEETGIVFEYPDEAWDIYIPDHIGNTLHLAIKLQ